MSDIILTDFQDDDKNGIKNYLKQGKFTISDCLEYIKKNIDDKSNFKNVIVDYIADELVVDLQSVKEEYFSDRFIIQNFQNPTIKRLSEKVNEKYSTILDKMMPNAILNFIKANEGIIPEQMYPAIIDYIDEKSYRFSFTQCEAFVIDCCENKIKHNDNTMKINSLLYGRMKECINKLNLDYKKYISDHKNSPNKYKKSIAQLIMDLLPLDLLKEYAPQVCQDPDPSKCKLKGYQHNTGVYLWKCGYEIKQFLGAGSFGVVWETADGKAVKVLCGSNKVITAETINVSKVQKLFEDDPDAKNYILENKNSMKYSNIVCSILAVKDMFENTVAQSTKIRDSQKGGKTIASFLRKAMQGIEATKKLHDKGYSHNDIKLENFMKIENNHIGSDGKKHKSRMVLGDLGTITPLTEDYRGGSKEYLPQNHNDILGSNEARAKRDVYALGITLLSLLFRGKYGPPTKQVQQFRLDYIYDWLKLDEMYPGTKKENVIKVLELIRDMTKESHRNRITIDQAYTRIRQINAD